MSSYNDDADSYTIKFNTNAAASRVIKLRCEPFDAGSVLSCG